MMATLEGNILTLTTKYIQPVDNDQLERLYLWLDDIPFSRKKKNLSRDFSDGVMVAELVKYFLPQMVDLHAFSPASSSRMKEHNWFHLNKKVLNKVGLEVSPDLIRAMSQCKQWSIENVLMLLREKLDVFLRDKQAKNTKTDATAVRNLDSYHEKPESDRGVSKDGAVLAPNGRVQFVQGPGSILAQYTGRGSSVPVDYSPLLRSPRNQEGKEMVPRALLTERLHQLETHSHTIEILSGKIERLEHLLYLKDIRVEDLSARLEKLESYNKMANPLPTGACYNGMVNEGMSVWKQRARQPDFYRP